MPRSTAPLLVLLLAAGLGGCRATTPPPTTAPPAAPPAWCGNDVHWMATSAEYRALLHQAYRQAGERVEELAQGRAPGTWAVAVDADETLISNQTYEQEQRRAGRGYDRDSFAAWTRRRAAPVLPGVLSFLDRVRRLEGKIAIVTNRLEATCDDTEANLEALGVPYDVILCRGEDRQKEGRWQQVAEGTAAPDLPPLDILLWVGDNIQDFPHLDQELRAAGDEAFERFGGDFIVLPNPVYGSWEDNPEE